MRFGKVCAVRERIHHVASLTRAEHTIPSNDLDKLRGELKNLVPTGVPQPVRVENLLMTIEYVISLTIY